jgi:hypothetical protein
MSQKPTKRNKDSKEVSEENIEKPIDNEDPAIGDLLIHFHKAYERLQNYGTRRLV